MFPRTAAEARVLRHEQENIRAALAWARDTGQRALLADLAVSAAWHWWMEGMWPEAHSWLRRVEEQAPTPQRKVDALFARAVLARGHGDTAMARRLLRRAITEAGRLGNDARMAYVLGFYAIALADVGEIHQAVTVAQEAYQTARTCGDLDLLAFALHALGHSYQDVDPDAARTLFTEAVDTARTAGNDVLVGLVTGDVADAALAAGDAVEATTRAEEALRHPVVAGAPYFRGVHLSVLGGAWLARGDLTRAELILREALRVVERVRTPHWGPTSP